MINFEHAAGDGLTWNRWMVEAWYNMNNLIDEKYPYAPLDAPDVSEGLTVNEAVKPLTWKLSGENASSLHRAADSFKNKVDNVTLKVIEFDGFGKSQIKNWKVSPDAAAQMAMQLAYHKSHSISNPQEGESLLGVPVYEACGIKSYFHGRTETIRSCTKESTEMCAAFLSTTADKDAKREAFLKACATHVEVAKGAKSYAGPYQGIDRHLYSLKCLAAETGQTDVPFFQDPAYGRSSTWILSTSNVTTPFFRLFGFGAVSANGYGIGYQTFDNNLPFCVANYKNSEDGTDAVKYTDNIAESLEEFNSLFK